MVFSKLIFIIFCKISLSLSTVNVFPHTPTTAKLCALGHTNLTGLPSANLGLIYINGIANHLDMVLRFVLNLKYPCDTGGSMVDDDCHTYDGSMSLCWRHQMETFSALLAICAGDSLVPSEFSAQRPVTRSFDVFFDLRTDNGWVNNGEAGDSIHHRAQYDVIVMSLRIRN